MAHKYVVLLSVVALSGASAQPVEEDPVVIMEQITLQGNQESANIVAQLEMKRSQDPAAAACAFVEKHGIHDVSSVLTLANILVKKAEEKSHQPPAELRLRTAGAHVKKSEELAKDGEHDQAAVHLIRALLRSGLDEALVERLKRQFGTAMTKLSEQRRLEALEAAEAAAAEARRVEEAQALEEARARAARDEEDWRLYMEEHVAATGQKRTSGSVGLPAEGEAAGTASEEAGTTAEEAPRLVVPILLNRPNPNGGSEPVQVQLEFKLVDGRHEDVSHAIYEFCSENGLHSADEVTKIGDLVQQRLIGQTGEGGEGGENDKEEEVAAVGVKEHLANAARHGKEGDYAKAGAHYVRALRHPHFAGGGARGSEHPPLSDDEREAAHSGLVSMMRGERIFSPFLWAVRAGEWQVAISALEAIPREQRSAPRLQLLEARANQMLGRYGNAQRAAARVVEAYASYTPWVRGQPRMLAVSLGTAAALETGDGQKALSFLSSVLKYDPDQGEVRKQYRQLKEVLKLMERAEAEVTKGYNHRAVKELDVVLGKLRGMDVGNTLLRAQVLLKLCRARSSMNKHVEAMEDCETAYRALAEPGPGVHVHPARVREALRARAQAHEADKNFDAAVADLRAAIELAGGAGSQNEAAQELEQSLRRALDLQRRWQCVDPADHQAWQQNRCGHPGDPNSGRDHRAVLELPSNLGDLPREDQCSWVSKQYRKLAKRWHPDRYKGGGKRADMDKARAERKMRECAEAKEVLAKQLQCGGEGGSKRGRRGRG
jgi:tetratricopeptide (TPR) repeat protein